MTSLKNLLGVDDMITYVFREDGDIIQIHNQQLVNNTMEYNVHVSLKSLFGVNQSKWHHLISIGPPFDSKICL